MRSECRDSSKALFFGSSYKECRDFEFAMKDSKLGDVYTCIYLCCYLM